MRLISSFRDTHQTIPLLAPAALLSQDPATQNLIIAETKKNLDPDMPPVVKDAVLSAIMAFRVGISLPDNSVGRISTLALHTGIHSVARQLHDESALYAPRPSQS